MPREPERAPERGERTIERAIVLQVLRDDHDARWLRVELEREIGDFEPAVLRRALERLERAGVLHRDGSCVRASHAVRRLDELDLVGL
jgi:DNA-binding HxlR family transcriptional regulator